VIKSRGEFGSQPFKSGREAPHLAYKRGAGIMERREGVSGTKEGVGLWQLGGSVKIETNGGQDTKRLGGTKVACGRRCEKRNVQGKITKGPKSAAAKRVTSKK